MTRAEISARYKVKSRYTERDSAGALWVLPTTTIRTFADEALTVSFKKPA